MGASAVLVLFDGCPDRPTPTHNGRCWKMPRKVRGEKCWNEKGGIVRKKRGKGGFFYWKDGGKAVGAKAGFYVGLEAPGALAAAVIRERIPSTSFLTRRGRS